MNVLNFPFLQNAFNTARACLAAKSSEWAGHIVTKLQLSLPYLENPRRAGVAVFAVNFGILELAARLSQLSVLFLPMRTATQRHIHLLFKVIVMTGLTVMGNSAFIKVTKIGLSPFVVTTIVVATFMIKYNIESYLENES